MDLKENTKPNPNKSTDTPEEMVYNVMPKANGRGPMVKPKPVIATTTNTSLNSAPSGPISSSTESATKTGQTDNMSSFSLPHSNRKVVMIVLAILALGLLGVFGYFGFQYAQQRNNPEPNNTEIQSDQDTEDNEQPQEGVTTPLEWQKRYFSSEQCVDTNVCGDSADPDRDGLTNVEEYDKKTDPNNPDSDADGLADGDEVHVFGGSPLTDRTNSGEEYKDSDFAIGGYDIVTNVKYTDTQLEDIKRKIKEKGLHQPTIKTLGADALRQYDFTDLEVTPAGDSSAIDSSIDQSPTAKLSRDTQRSNTVQKIAGGLTKYKAARGSFPATTDYNEMISQVKSYISVATNFDDPINKDRYVYGYVPANANQEFSLLYFSETQNLVIKYTSQQAELDQIKNNASANDEKRRRDIENIALALGLYSDANSDINNPQNKVFPTEENYRTVLATYMSELPKDPRTGKDYVYEASATFDAFTLKAVYDNPPKGYTGFMCNQLECKNY